MQNKELRSHSSQGTVWTHRKKYAMLLEALELYFKFGGWNFAWGKIPAGDFFPQRYPGLIRIFFDKRMNVNQKLFY